MVAPLFLKLPCVNMRARPPIKVLQIQAGAPARLSSSRHDLHIKESIEQAGQTVKGAEPSSKSDFTPLRCCNSSPSKHTHTTCVRQVKAPCPQPVSQMSMFFFFLSIQTVEENVDFALGHLFLEFTTKRRTADGKTSILGGH